MAPLPALQLENIRVTAQAISGQIASLSTTEQDRAKLSGRVKATNNTIDLLKNNWGVISQAVAAANKVRTTTQQQAAAPAPRLWQTHCRAVSVRLEEALDQSLMNCRAAKRPRAGERRCKCNEKGVGCWHARPDRAYSALRLLPLQ